MAAQDRTANFQRQTGSFPNLPTICEELYHSLGLETISPTKVGAKMLKEAIER